MSLPQPIKMAVRSTLKRFGFDLVNLKRDEDTSRFLPYHLHRQLAHHHINCVFDVGANHGQFALQLRASGYSGRIISVEPIPRLCELLRAKADPDWQIVNIALGDREGTQPFNVCASDDYSSLLVPDELHVPDAKVEEVIQVKVTTLDALFGQFHIPDPRIFLKMDTQGYDLRVVKGGVGILDKIQLIQAELSTAPMYDGVSNYTEALEFFRTLGFLPTGFFTVYRAPDTGMTIEYDVVLARHLNATTPAGAVS